MRQITQVEIKGDEASEKAAINRAQGKEFVDAGSGFVVFDLVEPGMRNRELFVAFRCGDFTA